MHNIQAAMQLSNQEKIMAYGMVTVDRSIRFMVQVRKYQTKSGEEKLFLCYPRKEETEHGVRWCVLIRKWDRKSRQLLFGQSRKK